MYKYLLGIFGLQLTLASCASPTTTDYVGNNPKLDIRQYFNGDLKAVGTMFTPNGTAAPQFTIAMHGSWQGNDGTLSEHFVYNDGFVQDRMWNIHFIDNHHLTATAADAVGVAVGEQNGNALNMHYVLNVPEHADPAKSTKVSMNDWIFLLDKKTGINRIQLSKFGFSAGELVITFQKQ